MLTDQDWNDLLSCIADKQCTPFIGAGASVARLPTGATIAKKWAKDNSYPFKDNGDLARVAEFVAINRWAMYPKIALAKEFESKGLPNFTEPDEPHGILADLELPIYITTNFDSFMAEAIRSRSRQVETEICDWNRWREVLNKPSVLEGDYVPSPTRPLVFHLHGNCKIPQSMVLTESDYLDFLVRLSGDQSYLSPDRSLLPAAIRGALSGAALLLMGYSLSDLDFRVVLRGLIRSLGGNLGFMAIAVQLPPSELADAELIKQAQDYLNAYFWNIFDKKIKICAYWGDIREFSAELRRRWQEFKSHA